MKRVSGREMCKVLERLGWTLDRIRGAHHIYRHPDGRTVPVPGLQEYVPGASKQDGFGIGLQKE